jgi:DNA-binding MarR family transcriptional regulator
MESNIMQTEEPGGAVPASAADHREMVEHTLQFADRVTRELLPLTPKEALMLDVTTAQLKIMLAIFLRGPIRMGTLARDLGVSLPTMTVTVDRLVKRDILLRENDPDDRRAVRCKLSQHGQDILNQLWNSARERTRQMLSVLSIDELRVVNESLQILLKAGQITRETDPQLHSEEED